MNISSPAFGPGAVIPVKYTCNGENISPPLAFSDIPVKAKSLVLTVEDMDATPVPWIHWFVYNIPPDTVTVGEGMIPEGGFEGIANGGTPGYEGPCPRYFAGIHHYQFNLYALDAVVEARPTLAKPDIAMTLQEHTIDMAQLACMAEGTGG